MTKTAAILLSILLLTFIIAPFTVETGNAVSGDKKYVIKSSVKFTAPPGHGWNFTEDDKAIGFYMNTSWQTVSLVNSSHQFESVKINEDGNSIAVLNMPNIKAGESTEYAVVYDAVAKPRNMPSIEENAALPLSEIPHNLSTAYLNNTDTWMSNNAMIRNLAFSLRGDETKVLAIVGNFVSWIWKNITYASHELPLYPNETLSAERGDCDDQAILLISFCRTVGIPAYLQIGCIYRSDITNESSFAWNGHVENVQNHIGWHGWAMVYVPPWGWLPVDLTYVPPSLKSNPLSAIESGAVTMQDTVQYMNFVKADYVFEAREYKNFLINNDFHITTYDEMTLKQNTNPFGFILESLDPIMIGTLLIAGIAVGVAGLLVYIKYGKMKKLKPLPC